MLKLEHVKKTFNKGSANEVILYRDLNVEIHDGEFVTIIGSNGSGKSTFFLSLQPELNVFAPPPSL